MMLERLQGAGALLAIDQDPDAIAAAAELCREHKNFVCEQLPFARLGESLERRGWMGDVSGILLDLGVSSPQLDNPERGFSFMRDGPLDMRMDPGRGQSAASWLNEASEKDIATVLWRYGEERYARRIAAAIVAKRLESPLQTTANLVALVDGAVPSRERHKHNATRTFQAVRIFVNSELEQLEQFLSRCLDWLKPGGRLAVLSFHSLEDRMVKRFMRNKASGDPIPSRVPVRDAQLNRKLRILVRAGRASASEVAGNSRARSAVLRVAEKI